MTDIQHSKNNSEKTETLNNAINALKIIHKQSRQYINHYSGLSLHQLLKLYWFAIHDQEALQQANYTVKEAYAIFVRFLSNIEFDIFDKTCSPHSIFNQLISTLMGIHPLVSHLNYVALPNNLFSKINIDADENEVRPFSDHESEYENSNKSFLL